MADYNVNMKQWNGTSFDNVLPLAYNAKQLEGQSLAEVKQWVQDNGLLLYTGQYVGNGNYNNSTKPTSATFPFSPILFFMPSSDIAKISNVIVCSYLATDYKNCAFSFSTEDHMSKGMMKKSADGRTISWYSKNGASARDQENVAGKTYYFAAIGGFDMGGQLNG